MNKMEISSDFIPSGDQPNAIKFICDSISAGKKDTILLGVTGSGKTYTIAKVIEHLQRTSIILAPNKTLAAQLYSEMKSFFPNNAVEYFVSYYDYYQPESYLPMTDTFIDKEATINDQIDQLRHSATRSLIERRDTVVVASVSCIYGIGNPIEYTSFVFWVKKGESIARETLLHQFIKLQYERTTADLKRGTFRANGDIIEIFPAHLDSVYWRISLEWDKIDSIEILNAVTKEIIQKVDSIKIYPNTHFLIPSQKMPQILEQIKSDLEEHVKRFESEQKFIEAQRIRERVSFDIEMLQLTGHCRGIENYSRYLIGGRPGDPPPTLFHYLPSDAILFIDESHVSVPQVGAMYNGDAARKSVLANYGFRLEACKDNRPLKFEEFEAMRPQTVYVSATPGKYELSVASDNIVEQIIRPTGLVDPVCTVCKTENQMKDLLRRCREKIANNGRVLITTLTKKMAESLSEYFHESGIKAKYMHSDIETLERISIIQELKKGVIDVLIGINLLREGLDIPECTLVAILDADKEGFLRSASSLIQTIGRAARNVDGEAILYADNITKSMSAALSETDRRRSKQIAHNLQHGIIAHSVVNAGNQINELSIMSLGTSATCPLGSAALSDSNQNAKYNHRSKGRSGNKTTSAKMKNSSMLKDLTRTMHDLAKNLEFEKAASIRDKIKKIEKK